MPTCRHTALQCLAAVARHHGLDLDVERLVHDTALTSEPDAEHLAAIAAAQGLTARAIRLDWDTLIGLGAAFPAIALLDNGNAVILSGRMDEGEEVRLAIVDPLAPQAGAIAIDRARFTAACSGTAVLLKRRFSLGDPDQPFGLRWFIPEILRQRGLFGEIGLMALVLNALALAVPIFFQLVIDKVLVHHAISTLYVIGAGVLIALVFEAVLGYLRSYFLLYATTRIDVRLTTRTFGHLLSLPSMFFEASTAGVLVKHMQQASVVREFLTGRLFMTLLDASVLIVFIPTLAFYSLKLTAIVIGFSLAICAVIGLLIVPYRRRLQQLYRAEGSRQALLVETIHGMPTIKALGLEARQRRQWDGEAAHAIERHFEVGKIAMTARQISALLERLMMVAVVWGGVESVFAGTMSVGALVAFQMLAGRVSGPLVALVGLLNEYQEAALSVRMLGEVMNQPAERNLGRGLRTKLRGEITLTDVRFQYPRAVATALDGVSLTIPAGAFVGIVGPSGSGKTTLTRLIQTLLPVQSGIVRFDGADVREMDLADIRRQMGVVLQDAFLFRGSVRDNIAATRPGASLAEIMEAARQAGAQDFIELLPQGFDTLLEEGATNLSGGQKQRLAIARALLRDPPILILDEATSALDPESEAVVVANLERFARQRTTIAISHRLTTIRSADLIVVLDRGRVVGHGPHEALLRDCPLYRQLWGQQTSRAA
ncbi:peptidase domain-containing ABC transporter [Ancylobacter sonchi]|uniref:peptidase domain-containing ABC transporter n=1 Tax=Ancylobacter sonchi TaxID=1937790 RepID=UPI001BD55229|nr:peptidase domain-containing ABC transporter [Ancylobacter sonchi]MBS7533755.1 peptidase domain-containing ABC transporter [Ancylobacter sonchi]